MARNDYGIALTFLLVAVPAAASATDPSPAAPPEPPPAETAGEGPSVSLPIRNADRPSVLPRHAVRIDTSLNLASPDGGVTYELDGVLGGGFGFTDWLEVGGQFVPGVLAPEPAFGSPLFYGALLAVGGNWTVVPTLQISVPVRSADAWLFDGLVVVSGTVDNWLLITVSPSISMTVNDQPNVTVALPVQAALQMTDRVLLGAQTGLGFANFDTRTNTARSDQPFDLNDASFPLGFSATVTAGVDDGPFADIGLLFLWPALLEVDPEGELVSPGDWALLLSVSTYFRP